MFEATLPTMPRLLTALAEWLGCTVMLLLMKKRWSHRITAVVMLLFGVLIIASQYYTLETCNGIPQWMAGMFFCALLMLAYMLVCSSCRISTAVGSWACAFTIAEFLASMEWQISSALLKSRSMKDPETILLMLAVFGASLGLMYFMERKLYDGEMELQWIEALLMLVIAALSIVISNVLLLDFVWENYDELRTALSSVRTMTDFIGLAGIYLIQRAHRDHEMKLELAHMNYMLNLQYKQYQDFRANSEYISRQCHDLKHQIQVLRDACTEEEREKSLQEMETAIQNYNAQNVTGNPVLDVILTQKKMYCSQHHIQLSCTVDARQLKQIAVRDISTLFGNIIDNAIECVIQYENEEDRMIQGEVYQKDGFLMIRFDNCFYGKLEYEKNFPVTTKANRSSHGYGLKSVGYTVKKYHGTMRISTENNWFSIKILIPIQND